ncbi:hypothetical protein G6514_005062 [Epicoccum nigrum]|nr:hypothetical protein G6514_005062 [Epicoccum nigrum]
MNTTRTARLLRSTWARNPLARPARRTLTIEPQTPQNAPPPPPREPPKEPSRVGAFYKSFSAPILKCFLGALFTYQLAYFGWMKLETIEEAYEKKEEIRGLRGELAGAMNEQKRGAEGVVERVGEKVVEEKEGGRKRGWW